MLLGIAIRTGSPLSLNLAEPVWKQLAGMNLTIADLSEVTSRRERTENGTPCVSSAKHGGGHLWSGEEVQPALRSQHTHDDQSAGRLVPEWQCGHRPTCFQNLIPALWALPLVQSCQMSKLTVFPVAQLSMWAGSWGQFRLLGPLQGVVPSVQVGLTSDQHSHCQQVILRTSLVAHSFFSSMGESISLLFLLYFMAHAVHLEPCHRLQADGDLA